MTKILRALQSFDAAFPIGAYTLSSGMETYVELGLVNSFESLSSHLQALLQTLPFCGLGVAAAAARGFDAFELDSLCQAFESAEETRRGSRLLCSRFLTAQAALSSYHCLSLYSRAIHAGKCFGHYPVAVGLFIRDLAQLREGGIHDEIPGECAFIEQALGIFCYSQLASQASCAAKLVPLRNLDTQRALYAALEKIPCAVQMSLLVSVDELGASGPGFSLRTMQHETLAARLFIS
jgi:urease accessory protein